MPENAAVPERCYEVLTNVLIKSEDGNKYGYGDVYGDVFVMPTRLIYSPLAKVYEPQGGAANSGGDPVKWITRDLGLRKQEDAQEARQNALSSASDTRRRQFGYSLESRIKLNKAVVLLGSDVLAINLHSSLNNAVEIVRAAGPPLIIQVGDRQKVLERLQLWASGAPVNVDSDRQGIDLALPQHHEVLRLFETSDAVQASLLEGCVRASQAAGYCKVLADILKYRAWPKRVKISERIRTECPQMAVALGTALAAAPGSEHTIGIAIGVGIFVFCFAMGQMVIVASVLAGIVVVILGFEARTRVRNKRLARLLTGTNEH